jgi:hypothetical protein
MAKDLAVVLNNGSLNGAVATALAAQRHRVVMLFAQTSPDGGDATAGPRAAFDRQVAHFKPYRDHVLDLSFLADARDGDGRPPAHAGIGADPRHEVPVGPQLMDLVPLVGVALRFAAHHGAAAVHLGLRVGPTGDAVISAAEFGQVWSELVQMPCGLPDLSVEMPLLELEAWQVVDVGAQAHVPFDRTWSCDGPGPEPCWACHGCRAREAAFHRAAKPDPLRVPRKV